MLTHALCQLPVWLIFGVRQKNHAHRNDIMCDSKAAWSLALMRRGFPYDFHSRLVDRSEIPILASECLRIYRTAIYYLCPFIGISLFNRVTGSKPRACSEAHYLFCRFAYWIYYLYFVFF